MKLDEVLQIAVNKRNSLQEEKNLAFKSGDLASYYRLEEEIAETSQVIEKLTAPPSPT
jgi:hypothetical protein